MGKQVRVSGRGVGIFLSGAVLAGALVWAAGAVLQAPDDPLEAERIALIEVAPGEVGSSISLTTIAEWAAEPVGVNQAVGVVTGVDIEQGAEVSQGTVAYRVNERPVVVARGQVPAFRDVTGGTTGEDVRQLQELLTDLGFHGGEVNGIADAATVSAIREWQESIDTEPTGTIQMSNLIFVPKLPAHVTLEADVVFRGANLNGGEHTLSALPEAPRFGLPVTTAQAQIIPSGTRVEIMSPDGEIWAALAGEQTSDDTSGGVTIGLLGLEDDTVCAEQCHQISVTGRQSLASTIVTDETIDGLVVPSSALVSTASGELAVVDEAGQQITVTVIASARGMSVVEGVDAGTKVRVPGELHP